ncbi:nucleotidyltransferase family protein [Aliiroseovarius sp. S253]|uniref:nucleotidyltransferase family protein n=1 Tax=Aliiroseovarius sp. S253 TaxID=3415133 RepID=UPI003C7C2519
MTAANIAVVLLAAGLSRRMGQDKLLRTLPSGQSLLEDRIRMINSAGVVPFVAVPDKSTKLEIVDRLSANAIPIETQGMGHSLSTAVNALPEGIDGIMVMLSDLPDVTSVDLGRMIERFDSKTILRASSAKGTPGHPVIFPTRYRPQLEALSGDKGAKVLLDTDFVDLFPLPGQNAVRDLDTPEDWDSWVETGSMTRRR